MLFSSNITNLIVGVESTHIHSLEERRATFSNFNNISPQFSAHWNQAQTTDFGFKRLFVSTLSINIVYDLLQKQIALDFVQFFFCGSVIIFGQKISLFVF